MQHQFQQDFLGPTLDEVAASITSQFRGQLNGPSQLFPIPGQPGRYIYFQPEQFWPHPVSFDDEWWPHCPETWYCVEELRDENGRITRYRVD